MWWTQWGSKHTLFPLTPQSLHLELPVVAEFIRELYRLLSITLSTTTAYHPQVDRQTECVNQELEQYLRVFVNERQDDWDELLPMAEFQYNNHIHSGTQQTL